MTYMPGFIQPAVQVSQQDRLNLEAELLKQRSRDCLSQLITGASLAAPVSTYRTRLEAELQIIKNKGFCGYFLIVDDYVNSAKDNGIAVGPGRGSGPCCLVGFVLGITAVDPIKYNLPFERFINPDRQVLPDFDLDFCGLRHEEVSSYIQLKYGADRVAQISSTDNHPLPSRLVICDRPLAELVPLYANPQSGFPATPMTIAQIASAGLVQFNVINQNALTIIQHTVEEIALSGVVIDINHINLDDKKTYQLLGNGELSHIDSLDGKSYQATLIAVQPQRFADLCAVIALSWPDLQDYIPVYVEHSHHPEQIQYLHPALESIIAATYGLILYQEQVMHIAHEIAGFSYARSDTFRRALKNPDSHAASVHKTAFINGAVSFGLSKSVTTELLNRIALSNQHNQSHSIAFAIIVYQIAWLKANYPHEFLKAKSAVLNSF